MHRNEGNLDRIIRLVIAAAAIAVGAVVGFGSVVGIIAAVVAVIMVVTAAIGFCPLYAVAARQHLPEPSPAPVSEPVDEESGVTGEAGGTAEVIDTDVGAATAVTPDALVAEIPGLWRFALALMRNETDAEDLVQDTLARALERSATLPGRVRPGHVAAPDRRTTSPSTGFRRKGRRVRRRHRRGRGPLARRRLHGRRRGRRRAGPRPGRARGRAGPPPVPVAGDGAAARRRRAGR